MKSIEKIFQRGLIVSCQAKKGEALFGSEFMARMAIAAYNGGACGIRANGPDDIRAIHEAVSLPIIGINKIHFDGIEVYITPTFESAKAVFKAGADMIAIDGTNRPRPDGEKLETIIKRIHEELDIPVMADCSTVKEGIEAAKAGADIVASTLAGYTPYTQKTEGPDMEVLKGLINKAGVPVIAEGRFYYPEQAALALEIGAYSVVVGGAITRPQDITRRFMDKI
jgi:N-acylglucosamine-6-phosphate 2-epimerase